MHVLAKKTGLTVNQVKIFLFSYFVFLWSFCLFVFLSFCGLFVFLFFCLFVFLSWHHSDQMSEGSQVSKVTLCDQILNLKWHPVTDNQSTELPGQLKKLTIEKLSPVAHHYHYTLSLKNLASCGKVGCCDPHFVFSLQDCHHCHCGHHHYHRNCHHCHCGHHCHRGNHHQQPFWWQYCTFKKSIS